MDIKTGLIKEALSSCYLRTDTTAIICSIFIEQKNEGNLQINVEFSNRDLANIHASIKYFVESLFLVRSRSTRIKVILYVVKEGPDLFSCCINSLSICAIFSGLRISDTICSAILFMLARKDKKVRFISRACFPCIWHIHFMQIRWRRYVLMVP